MTRSRRQRGGHGGGGGGGGGHGGGDARWLVTYADLLTLLMVLFLVLWVISTIDLQKFERFKDGLGDFGNPSSHEPVDSIPGNVVDDTPETGDTLPETAPVDFATTTTTTTAVTTTTVVGGGEGEGDGAYLDAEQLLELQAGLEGTISAAGLAEVVTVQMQQRGLVVSVTTDDVLFAPASGELEAAASHIVDVVAAQLALITNPIIVEGYTDKRPINRANYDNWDLSVDRAVSVVKLLRDTYHIDPSRLAATGYGDQHPVATGDDEASYRRNRRVQIVIVAAPD